MINKKISLLALALAAISSQAFAGSTTGAFQSTATLNAACNISTTNIAFGTVTPASTGNLSSTATLTATCSRNWLYYINISAGSGTFTTRTMTGAIGGNTDKLAYNLYTSSAATTVLGDGSGSTGVISAGGTGTQQVFTVYGQVPLNQYLKPDTYSDTLTVTIGW